MSLRNKIEKSPFLAAALARLAGGYLSFCNRTTRWETAGLDALEDALIKGPVLVVVWHSRSIMGSLHWPVTVAPLSSLYANSPIGRVAGALQRRMGLHSIEMSDKTTNLAASRMVLKRAKDGVSIALTGDGPLGPARAVKDAPLEWARTTGIPVFCYAFATTKARRLGSWDQMLVPKAFGKGAYVFRQFPHEVPRKMDDAMREEIREKLKLWMDETTAEADKMIGQPPGP
ncbi:lysophospholipid acyltransferase family protein [Yoonia sp.]|uniref:lysophospholipid acyltransferase family protein n=1 Tax=Yoonia sp. TaxID=2212373 RepID=UPI0023B7621D